MQSNTTFITGGTSGIGRGLAEAFHGLGNRVILGGRRRDRLEAICDANPGMGYAVIDVRDPASIRRVAGQLTAEFPTLDCVFNNAGVQRGCGFQAGEIRDEQGVLEEIEADLLGVIRVASAFVPHLRTRESATIVNTSSGLAFVPLGRFPVYCATKAAVHSFTLSLRHQLKDTAVKVVELIPPYVESELGGASKYAAPDGAMGPMSLDDFIAEAMRGLAGDADEVPVGGALNLAAAAGLATSKQVFAGMNH